jgi:histidyl-tRNA synthetase
VSQPLSGFRDFLPDELKLRKEVLAKVECVIARYGFEPLETPTLERAEVLFGQLGDDEKLIYAFDDHGGRRVGMRFDLTVPAARVVAGNRDLPRPFRRYQTQPVWRADAPGHGRFREFLQYDFDTYGSSSVLYDAEILCAVHDALDALSLPRFEILVNDRRVLSGLLALAGFEPAVEIAVLRSLDKLDKIGAAQVRVEIVDKGLPGAAADRLLGILGEAGEGGWEERLETIARRFAAGGIATGSEGVAALRCIFETVTEYGLTAGSLVFAPALARGLGYYTGPIHEVVVPGGGIGSICGGGRYDDLVGGFSGEAVPATGTSLGIERIMAILGERYIGRRSALPHSVLLCATEPLTQRQALSLAGTLRGHGLVAETFLDAAPLRRQLRYANKRGFESAVIFPRSSDETTDLILKDMASGDQQMVPLEELLPALLARRKESET